MDVILDFGFWTRQARESARAAETVGAESRLYWVRCEDQLAIERIRRRNADPGDGFYLSDGSIDYLRGTYESLVPDEEHIVIHTD